jgi:hypothetical protein
LNAPVPQSSARQSYPTKAAALGVARGNSPARRRLRSLGSGHAIVAEVVNNSGQYELLSVTVREITYATTVSTHDYLTGKRVTQHIALRFEDL